MSDKTIVVTSPESVTIVVSQVGTQGPSGSVAGALLATNNFSDVPLPETALATIGGLAIDGDGSGLSGIASSAQGSLADSALQSADIGSTVQAWSTVLDNTTASFTLGDETKLDYITVSQAVDLDQMEIDIAALANGMVYKGDWDASSGSFAGSGLAQTGWFYYVSVAGIVDGVAFAIGDNIVATTDDASATTFTGNWSKHDQTDAVQAVVGLTGSISKSSLLTALNVADGANVTNATTVEAAGALMDSELVSIIDVKALDQSLVSGATPTFDVANMTLDDTNLKVAVSTDVQTFFDDVDGALLKARSTGISKDFDTASVVVGGTTFTIPVIEGEIYTSTGYFRIDYAGAVGVTVADLTKESTWVYVDNTGTLQQQTTLPTHLDWESKLFVMRIAVDTSTSTIVSFEYTSNTIGHYANTIRDIVRVLVANGVPLKEGQIITGRAGDMGFDATEGSIVKIGATGNVFNANTVPFNQVTNAEFFLALRDATDAGGNTDLPLVWDNAGSLISLGSGTFVGHRLYRFTSGNFVLQYGQGNYADLTLAKAGVELEEYVLNPVLKEATFFGWWFVSSTASNTSGNTLTDFVEYTIGLSGGSNGALSGCVLRGNNGSDFLNFVLFRANVGLEIGVNVQAYDADTLKADVPDNLTAGFTASVPDDGTQSGGTTYTPSVTATPTDSNYKQIVNGGAFPLSAPTLATNTATDILIFMTNNASAGPVTTTAIDNVSGDSLTTTDGDKFILRMTILNIGGTDYSTVNVEALP
jgi:hypothetical protein